MSVKKKIKKVLGSMLGKSFKYCTAVCDARIISFDVFDTLIFRSVKAPEDVFSLIDTENPQYKDDRIEAEKYVRANTKAEDITLDEIYARLAVKYGNEKTEILKKQEIEKELEVSYANPDALRFFKYLREKGKRIVITSDMYLPKTVIAQILSKNGFKGYEKLYVSGDDGLAKRTGHLYERLISELGTNNIVHIGDHFRSDYIMPLRSGIKAFLFSPMNKIRVFSRTRSEIDRDCQKWAEKIGLEYRPDLIVFIAKSGFLFAEPMADHFGCPMVDISVSRPGNDGKDTIRKLIPRMPQKLLFALLSSKATYGYQETNSEREVKISERYQRLDWSKYKKILLVDDSADTGFSLIAAQNAIKASAPESEVRTACYCVIDISKKRVKVDYHRYRNTIVVSATSRYSDEYDDFIGSIRKWEESYDQAGNGDD